MSGIFSDRRAAGRLLARAVMALELADPVVLALPRGGVPLGFEVARALKAPLDILLVRKIGAPGHEEYAIGALVYGASPQVVIDEASARAAGADKAYVDRRIAQLLDEIERRRILYRTGPPVSPTGCTAIVVDDGIATGSTMRAALQSLAKSGAARIVLAVPLAPREVIAELSRHCDQVVCLASPEPFYAVGAHYGDFSQTEDAEVIALLAEARKWTGARTAAGRADATPR